MTAFSLLHTYVRTAILLLLLLLLLINGHIFAVSVVRIRRRSACFLSGLFILSCYVLLVILTAALSVQSRGRDSHPALLHIAGLPAGFFLLFLLLGGGAALWLIHTERAYRRSVITRAAIKESADNLTAGLCFGADSGLILLANRAMERLCYTLTGLDLQNASAFWDTIASGALKTGAERLPGVKNPIIRLPDGRTWSFTRRMIQVDGKPVMQITATDTTDLDILYQRLTVGNRELAKMNIRLRRFSESIVEVTAKEERLATKMRLHTELGHTLLTTRHILSKEMNKEEAQPILTLWKQNVAVLRSGAEAREVSLLEHLTAAAADVGICLHTTGVLPKNDPASQRLIITAGSEALNNAVRHAKATELYLAVSETDTHHTAVFSNNGKVPDDEIVEGGGLSALRSRIERQGGVMVIQSCPLFKLTVTLPKKGGMTHD